MSIKEAYAYEKLKQCVDYITSKVDIKPRVAIVLGSGLGEILNNINIIKTIDYSEISGLPISTVEGHRGRFIFGYVGQAAVLVMQGRIHFYEGYDIDKVVMPIRIARLLGAEKLIITNSSGGVNLSYYPGQLVLIKDHIASFIPNCLRGENLEFLGLRFPDMSNIYDKDIRKCAKEVGREIGITLEEGIYLQSPGPSFESPAEIKMYRGFGADMVGMSTACEAIAARHAGMDICGISCISNMAAGILDEVLTIEDVSKAAEKAGEKLGQLIQGIIIKLYKYNIQ